MTEMDKKTENIIEKLKQEIQYKKSLNIRKAQIEDKDNPRNIKHRIVLQVGETLFNKIKNKAEELEVSNQKVIESVLLKHFNLMRRKN